MNLPNFLVIGAMKCGTTTLYHDMASHPQIFLAEKECGALTHPVDRAAYARRFRGARPGAVCGDVSTTYAMFPDICGVPERARRLMTSDAKIIYVVREPLQRAISHHHHYQSLLGPERMEGDLDECVRRHASLIDYGRYALQLYQWLAHWELASIRVVRFEDYVANRRQTLTEICRFLGVGAYPATTDVDAARNVSQGKPVLNAFWARVALSGVYRGVVRPWLSPGAREGLSRLLLPTAPPRPAPPRPETIDRLACAFASDAERLRALTGRETPFWDFEAVRQVHLDRRQQWEVSVSTRAA